MTVKHWVWVKRGGGISIPGNNQDSIRWGPCLPDLVVPALSTALDQRPPQGSSPTLFYEAARSIFHHGKCHMQNLKMKQTNKKHQNQQTFLEVG